VKGKNEPGRISSSSPSFKDPHSTIRNPKKERKEKKRRK